MVYLTDDYEILTSEGFKSFDGIKTSEHEKYIQLTFDDNSIFRCSLDHLIRVDGEFTKAKLIKIDDVIENKKVINTEIIIDDVELYDPLNVQDTHHYISSGITSHNCADINSSLAQEFLSSIFPTISASKKSSITISSTPKGYNHYAKFWFGAVNGKNGFVPIDVDWREIPRDDYEKFKREETARLGSERLWLQEYECKFLGSQQSLLEPAVLEKLQDREPIIQETIGDNTSVLKVYEQPQEGHTYIFIVDIAEGGGKDYSTINVLDISVIPHPQIMTFRSNTLPYPLFTSVIDQLTKRFDQENLILLIESNDLGNTVCELLLLEYDNPSIMVNTEPNRLGMKMTPKTKKMGCSIFSSLMENEKFHIVDYDTIQECFSFTKKGNSFMADPDIEGSTDDLIMNLIIFSYFTTTQFYSDITNSVESFRTRYYADKEEKLMKDIPAFGFLGSKFHKEEHDPEIIFPFGNRF